MPHHSTIPETSGIYKITCTITQKFYIGSAVNLRNRWKTHLHKLRCNSHHSPKLQAAWNKHTEQSFTHDVLEFVLTPDLLLAREQYWIDTLHPEYNINLIAGSRLGMKHTPESRAKIGLASLGNTHSLGLPSPQRGKKMTPEARARMSATKKGKPSSRLGTITSPEARARMNKDRRGKKLSPEHRAKLSIAGLGNTNGLGYKATPEARAKMSQTRKGKTHTEAAKEKIRTANLGRKHTPEHRANNSAARKGRKQDPDTQAASMKTLIIIAPDGTEYLVTGIKRFCREHNLLHSKIMQVAQGRYKQHRGWTARFPDVHVN